jgi:hypothetical protein
MAGHHMGPNHGFDKVLIALMWLPVVEGGHVFIPKPKEMRG